MRRVIHRKHATRVRSGRVMPKNRRSATPTFFNTNGWQLEIKRERPAPGYRHLVKQKELWRFIELIPYWEAMSRGLNAIVLSGDGGVMGWYRRGVVALCGWDREIVWEEANLHWYLEHRSLLKKLGVPAHEVGRHLVRLEFTVETARAFQLVHVFVHEVGHHRDLMNTRGKDDCARGEPFAEAYAREFEDCLLERYFRHI